MARQGDAAATAPAASTAGARTRPQIDGHAFPDGVLALTWDDGPDADTLRLARFLAREKIAATFFVVHHWVDDLSSDPGHGHDVFRTGYEYLPDLEELVRLGHRIGNHTLDHVLLADVSAEEAAEQLRDNQRLLDPYVVDELPMFRAPGGEWGSRPSGAVDGDPYLRHLVGPIKWDIDRKDWDASLSCFGDDATRDCEPAGPGGALRVKPSLTVARYLATIESQRHGIVLMHDRVGFVGSHYALEVAEALVPELEKRGFVFAAPILAFSPLRERSTLRPVGAIALGDLDGDGKADLCANDPAVACARAGMIVSDDDPRPHATFDEPSEVLGAEPGDVAWQLADVDGDGRDDLCARRPGGVDCASALAHGGFATPRAWSVSAGTSPDRRNDFADAAGWEGATVRFADVSGDHRADVCGRTAAGVTCARSLGASFERGRPWATAAESSVWLQNAPIELGDVDGDGRADACAWSADGVSCALSSGGAFRRPERWSSARGTADRWLGLGDLNGDGRADLCFQSATGVSCALSTGRSFTAATTWLAAADDPQVARASSFAMGDLNGDGRADLCLVAEGHVLCGVAP